MPPSSDGPFLLPPSSDACLVLALFASKSGVSCNQLTTQLSRLRQWCRPLGLFSGLFQVSLIMYSLLTVVSAISTNFASFVLDYLTSLFAKSNNLFKFAWQSSCARVILFYWGIRYYYLNLAGTLNHDSSKIPLSMNSHYLKQALLHLIHWSDTYTGDRHKFFTFFPLLASSHSARLCTFYLPRGVLLCAGWSPAVMQFNWLPFNFTWALGCQAQSLNFLSPTLWYLPFSTKFLRSVFILLSLSLLPLALNSMADDRSYSHALVGFPYGTNIHSIQVSQSDDGTLFMVSTPGALRNCNPNAMEPQLTASEELADYPELLHSEGVSMAEVDPDPMAPTTNTQERVQFHNLPAALPEHSLPPQIPLEIDDFTVNLQAELLQLSLLSLVVRSVDAQIEPQTIGNRLKAAWKSLKGELKFRIIGNNWVLFTFATTADRDLVWENRPYHVLSRLVVILPYSPAFRPNQEEISPINVWIRLPFLPFYLANHRSISRILQINHLGTLIRLDQASNIRNRDKFMRFLINMPLDHTGDFKQYVTFRNVDNTNLTFRVWYEGFFKGCTCCTSPYHAFMECPIMTARPRSVVANFTGTEEEARAFEETARRFYGDTFNQCSKNPA